MKIRLFIISLVFIFFDLKSFSQTKGIEYNILNDTFNIDPRNPIIKINFEIVNNSGNDYLLFGYSEIESESVNFNSIKSLNCVLGNGLYILQGNKERIGGEPLHGQNDEQEFVSLDSWAKTSSIILRRNTSVRLEREISLTHFELEPWKYEFSLVYYSGNNVKNYFSEKEISVEEKKYGAMFFKGWIQSNSVPLNVRYER